MHNYVGQSVDGKDVLHHDTYIDSSFHDYESTDSLNIAHKKNKTI